MRKALTAVSLSAAAILLFPGRSQTCCMVPVTYEGTISQSAQEAILIHDKGREELILRINYKIAGKGLPDSFAWIVTVPNEPDNYAVADAAIFKETFDWAEALTSPPKKGDSNNLGEPAPAGVELGKAVKVGPYDIQPIRGVGEKALEGLNAWLKDHGFPTEDPKHMAWFVDNKFTFLCIRVTPAEGGKAVEAGGEIPPLHLSFKSETPYYPLRFSSRQGVFDVNLYVLTKKDFDYTASGESLKRINWKEGDTSKNVVVKPGAFPKTLKAEYDKSPFKDDAGEWKLNLLRARNVNEGNTISTWKEDIFFRTKS
ncbi:MAG: DUF2330 domain-containing protein [Planctomycetes bacterium]|nr:DUF2330 domain-containing protein [Planctomycetota bacterium]